MVDCFRDTKGSMVAKIFLCYTSFAVSWSFKVGTFVSFERGCFFRIYNMPDNFRVAIISTSFDPDQYKKVVLIEESMRFLMYEKGKRWMSCVGRSSVFFFCG